MINPIGKNTLIPKEVKLELNILGYHIVEENRYLLLVRKSTKGITRTLFCLKGEWSIYLNASNTNSHFTLFYDLNNEEMLKWANITENIISKY